MVRGADLFAFASQTETQGLVLAEALACGLPVVALAGPGVTDSVRDDVDGVVVPRSGDAAGGEPRLGAAIAALAGDPERRAAMAAAAADGAERFDVSRRMAEVVALYREVLPGASRPVAACTADDAVAPDRPRRTMPAMRVSLTARYVSHPTIHFGADRPFAPSAGWGSPVRDRLPPPSRRAPRAADGGLAAPADEPLQLPVGRPRRPHSGPPHRPAARPPARSPRVAGRWPPSETPAPPRRVASSTAP